MNIHAIDVNSGVEFTPAVKDVTKVKQVIASLNKWSYGLLNPIGYEIRSWSSRLLRSVWRSIHSWDALSERWGASVITTWLSLTRKAFKKRFIIFLKDYVGRPTPLFLAQRLSEKYKAKIYLKREDLCHTGAHKVNNTIGQILLAQRLGKKKIIAETGAGQHGVATATVCALMGMDCVVYMGQVDMETTATECWTHADPGAPKLFRQPAATWH